MPVEVVKADDAVMLGLTLRRSRERLGYSLDKLAKETGITKPALIHIEKGRGGQIGTLFKYCTVLGVNLYINGG